MSPIDSTLGIDGLVVQSVKHAQHTRQGNELMVLHLAVPKYHCTHCNRYSGINSPASARAYDPPRPIAWRSSRPTMGASASASSP